MRPRLNFRPIARQPATDQHERRARLFLRCRVAALMLFVGAYLNVMVAWDCAAFSPIEQVIPLWSHGPRPAWVRGHRIAREAGWHEQGFGVRVWVGSWYRDRLGIYADALKPSYPSYEGGMVMTLAAGFPMRALRCEQWLLYHGVPRPEVVKLPTWRAGVSSGLLGGVLMPDRRLPLNPIWTGFIFNSIFYSAVFAIPYLVTIPTALRRASRRRRGRCANCNYNRRGLPPDMLICPECGHADHNAPAGCNPSALLPPPPPMEGTGAASD